MRYAVRHAICLGVFLTAVAGCDDGADDTPPAEPTPDARALPPDGEPDAEPTPDARPLPPDERDATPDPDAAAPDAAPPDAAPPDAAPPDAALVCPTPGPEVCNGVDDDCDDAVDEGIEPTPCETGQPGVCAAGTAACVAGAIVCAPDTAAGDELCNGLDDDCDGAADEPTEPCYSGSPDTRGVGMCRDGLLGCVDGEPNCVGEVVPPAGLVFEQRRYPLDACMSVRLADLNGDGALDIVCHRAAGVDRSETAMLVNDGSGEFAVPVELDVSAGTGGHHTIEVADVDLDGALDLVASVGFGFVVVTDPLGPAPEPVAVPHLIELPDGREMPIGQTHGLTVGDLTGDGAPDIAFVAEAPGSGWFFALAVNEGRGTFPTVRAIGDVPGTFGTLSTQDVEGDGALDLIGCLLNGVYFARGGPDGRVEAAAPISPTACLEHLVADVTGDGPLDLVAMSQGEVWRAPIEEGPALGDRVWFPAQARTQFTGVAVGQLDCDSELEVLALVTSPIFPSPPAIYTFLDARTLQNPVVEQVDPGVYSIAVGDVDGDGIDDIVTGYTNGVQVNRRVP